MANTVGGTVSLLVNQLYASPTIGINESVVTILNDDLAPGSIVFKDVTGVAPSSPQTSNAVLITGISAPAAFSVNGVFAGINRGPCTLTTGSLVNGDSIRVCHTASASFLTTTNTALTVGAIFDTFTSTTRNSSAPSVSIGDAQISEGNSGTRTVNLTLTLSVPATADSSVRATTVPGSATEGVDYSRFSKTVKFVAGQTTARVKINITGDTTPEANETFFVNLDKPQGLTISDGQAVVTIINDD